MKIFQLSVLIQRELKLYNAYALEKRIQAANNHADERGAISHKVLKKLAQDPKRVELSYRQLVALDNYFNSVGLPGLDQQPIFLKTGVLDCLVEKPRLAFLLGSTPRQHEQRNDISRWDTRSLATLLQEVCRRSAALPGRREAVSFEIMDVLLNFPAKAAQFIGEEWYRLLDDRHASILSVGSPRASHASEIILARLFHQEPFAAPFAGDQLPFYFVWPEPDDRLAGSSRSRPKRLKGNPSGFLSRFALTAEDLIRRGERALGRAVSQGKACAFVLGDVVYPILSQQKMFKMYAVLAAARRSGGQTHVVVAGSSGPATHAAATMLAQVHAPLPLLAEQNSLVMYLPIEVDIRVDSSRKSRGDIRLVDKCRPIGKVRTWPPSG